jgi:hypothetical protein
MKADDQHMDDIFRKAAEEQHFAYKPDFWNDVEGQLNDDSLDAAFQTAAQGFVMMPDLNLAEAMDDAFLDDSFRSAAENTIAEYPANAWSSFLNEAAAIEQDIAFTAAANSVTTDYHPAFWSDADQALRNEGLHYEYKSAYWNDAKNLLDHADRKVFFFRWSAVAAILLLLSFGGIYQSFNAGTASMPLASESSATSKHSNTFAENNVTPDTDFTTENQSSVNEQNHTTGQSTLSENNTIAVQNNVIVGERNTELSIGNTTNPIQRTESLAEAGFNTNPVNSIETNPVTTNILLTQPELNTVENAVNTPEISIPANNAIQTSTVDLTTDLASLPENEINTLNPALVSVYLGPQIEIERFKLSPTHTLSLVGNAGIGNKYGEPDFTPSFRTSLGLEYRRTGFGRLRQFELGGSATMHHVRQNSFGTERRVNVFNKQGGVDKFWYKLQFKDMIYANVSGLVSYHFNKRNSVHLSLGLDYLVFVQSNMSYKINADENITTVNNNWGVKDGLTTMDARLGLGYEFAVTQRFAVQVNGSFGFFDRSDDAFISKNFFDHEMNATVGLKYTFLRKL